MWIEDASSLLIGPASTHLQQLKGSQQIPCRSVSSVNLVILQLRREKRGAVVLVRHLGERLGEGATYKLSSALDSHTKSAVNLCTAVSSWRDSLDTLECSRVSQKQDSLMPQNE